jgi:hypothetical protein
MELSYNFFSKKPVSEKIVFLEDWFSIVDIENTSEKEIRRFFRDILENEENIYVKKLGIETVVFLTMLEKVRKSATIEMLLDIEDDEDPFVLKTALSYLSLLYDGNKDIEEKLNINKQSVNPDVSSEAYYRLGMLKFFEANVRNNQIEFYEHLSECNKLFKYSKSLIENRTDAEYFYYVTLFLQSLLSQNDEVLECSYKNLMNTFNLRAAFHINERLITLEYKINKVIVNLYRIYKKLSQHEKWTNFYEEFKKLSEYNYELFNISVTQNEIWNSNIRKLKTNIKEQILNNLFMKNLNYYNLRIDNLINENKGDEDLISFLNYIKELINQKDKDVSFSDQNFFKICLMIKEIFPDAKPEDLLKELESSRRMDKVEDILKLISKYAETKYAKKVGFVTGFEVGEEIFNRILRSIEEKIPDYSKEKLQIFMSIVEEVIRYLILTVRFKKEEFKFLYTEKHGGKGDKATERDLQDSLYKHFMYSNIAYASREEIRNFADGGRVDIVFNIGNYEFPVELKKTKKEITIESIREKYLEQVSTYIYAYQQLGIFVLLDLNEKKKPVNDIRDLVYLDFMQPLYDLGNKFPDYIVVVIIPGNKPLPSDKSEYS